MAGQVPRLGDVIDDHCPRCRLLLNHAIASLVEGKVVKVVCQTCHSEHPYRQGEGAKKKKPAKGRPALFEQVLAKSAPSPAPVEELVEAPPPAPKKKPASPPARYISRHPMKTPRKGS